MSHRPLLVITPVLFARGGPGASGERVVGEGPLSAAFAAKAAGADVQVLGLAERQTAAQARALLAARGIDADFIECPAATLVVDDALAIVASRLPPVDVVDRLLDRAEDYLAKGVSIVVAAGDLLGAKKQDVMERVVGRAWGFGVKTVCAERGESLKQAFHTQPIALVVERDRLQWVTPPPPGSEATETIDGAIRRTFEDPIRVLLVLESDGSVTAITREQQRAPVRLGPLDEKDSRALMGALAANLARAPEDDALNAARAAYASVCGGSSPAERVRGAAQR